MLGKRLGPILTEIEALLLENYEKKPNFDKEAIRAAVYIFQSVVMDSMFSLQEIESMPLENREEMATKCGQEIRNLVKKYTDIDTHKL